MLIRKDCHETKELMKKGCQMKTFLLTLGIFLSTSVYALTPETAGLLSKIYQLSSKATQVGTVANGKLDDPRMISYNNRMINDHQVTKKTLEDTWSQLGIELPAAKSNSKELLELGKMKGKAFGKEYLKNGIDIHTQLLNLVKTKISPDAHSPLVKTILNNLSSRFSSLLDNAQSLQKDVESDTENKP